eukprot:CAMPEP_0185261766 /NCGR_PEP_ID=MMETSP1359-20130426/10093_1 /TAXON_ID=552665 /ORGANISM="Bigelowiella longifila, Strain CCMP242" /LENGTH=73 /DNA_ID=CAMNT_0027848499 /DNA_START=223 /DNA_END=444 /DNA_ORIENTATION=-
MFTYMDVLFVTMSIASTGSKPVQAYVLLREAKKCGIQMTIDSFHEIFDLKTEREVEKKDTYLVEQNYLSLGGI